MSRTVRALAALAALVGVVLGVLVCGASTALAVSSVTSVSSVSFPEVVGSPSPGCGQGHLREEGAAGPVVPPRANGFGELLPALAGERTACGDGGAAVDVPDLVPGPEPPELVPPSPVELSILRV
ncbi:hypothetical protein ACFV9D_10550 [Streptomyces sp. NPDC059875]|uniref:hypothetical protein n=1 Tax=unclassified Streptomyces TaxID=2593676 RepID=UPI00365C1D8A